MGIFPVEFPTTTADSFESFRVLHYLAFIKEEDVLIETCFRKPTWLLHVKRRKKNEDISDTIEKSYFDRRSGRS